ncbi:hypothetical protein [Brachybacterium kimchii]|uniref:Uncharacterized protein n=1 Tax=Brachybacterium kimchii TaxID=2942909 RepID=A0ABY4N995_9MICO|nr:hypothetical protein [Brachybacterium kimchii]UQN30676.1 hypothetical protein M4486_05065 [Brachybacterium kimchii]
MATYRLKVRTSTSALPFAYLSDPYHLTPDQADEQVQDMRRLAKLRAVHLRVDGELVVINPRHIVAIHRTEIQEES